MLSSRVLIVGAGHAGGRVAQHLCDLGFGGDVVLAGDEPHPPYERPALSKTLLQGKAEPADLVLSGQAVWAGEARVAWLRDAVASVDLDAKRASLASGAKVEFDVLVAASGASPRLLPAPGAAHARVFYLRGLDDSLRLRAALSEAKRLAIIGAGVIGLEVAATAVELGCEVAIFGAGRRALARAPAAAASWLTELHRSKGVVIEIGAVVEAIEETDQGVAVRARRADGRDVTAPADLILVAIGVEPNLAFLRPSGLRLEDGLEVDACCRSTAYPFLYAVGDAARVWSPLLGRALRQETWRNAENQARAVAEFICGRTEPFAEIPWMWTDQYGVNVQVVGLPDDGDDVAVREPISEGSGAIIYHRGGVVTGAVLVNQGRQRRWIEQLIRTQARVDPARLADPAIPLKDAA